MDDDGERVTLPEAIAETLRARMAARRFPEGLALTEAGLARAFRVSRTPARQALEMLHAERRLVDHAGRGWLVSYGSARPRPLRRNLADAGLDLSEEELNALKFSPGSQRILPELEKAVSSCMAFGRFHINLSRLAAHFGVSRAVAQEALARLEQAGRVRRDGANGWCAPKLTPEMARHHYAIRRLLEPEALRLAAPLLDAAATRALWSATIRLIDAPETIDFDAFDEAESGLHVELLGFCPNAFMVAAIRNSQAPLIATHFTFERYSANAPIRDALIQHLEVLTPLLRGDGDAAAAALRRHLEIAEEVTVTRLHSLSPLPEDRLPPYLAPRPEPDPR